MNKEAIEAKLKDAEDSFNELTKQKQNVEAEMLRLQGEYRTLTSLLHDLEAKKEKK